MQVTFATFVRSVPNQLRWIVSWTHFDFVRNELAALATIYPQYVERILYKTRNYLLRGYILVVLTHITALDRLWGGDGTLTMWF